LRRRILACFGKINLQSFAIGRLEKIKFLLHGYGD
jgi:hypothetical protein